MHRTAIGETLLSHRIGRWAMCAAILVGGSGAIGSIASAQSPDGAPQPEIDVQPPARPASQPRPEEPSGRYVDANADRVVLAQTAETHPAGTLYFSNYLILPQIGYAITNRTQITLGGLGVPSAGFVDLSIKSNLVRTRHIRVSVGAAIDYAGVPDLNFAFGRATSTLQWCFTGPCRSSLSATGMLVLHNAPGVAVPYGMAMGLTTYLSDTVTLLLEYTSILNATEDLFFLDFPFFFVSYGVRVRANPRWALDIAMINSLSNSTPTIGRDRSWAELLGLPFLAFTYRWGPAF